MAICAFWPNSQHLELDQDVFEVPLFKSAIMQYGSTYGVPSRSGFQSLIKCVSCQSNVSHYNILNHLLSKLNEQPGCTAVLITRPPEILACLKIPFASGRSIYAVFDSHPRPDHRDGAAIFFSSSPNVIISRLHDILEVDPSILTDTTLQWQAQLLSNFSGHFFVPTKVVPDADEVQSVLMETSLSIMHLRAENLTFRSRQRMLTSENARLEEELEAMHEKYRTLKLAKTKPDPPPFAVQSHELTTQKLDSDTQSSKPDTKLKGRALDVPSGLPGMALSTAPRNSRNGATSSIPGPSSHSNALIVSPKDALFDESAQLAYDLQQEDDRLFAERQMLIASSQIVFTCSICLEQLPEDSVARVENCGHKPCRDCMRQYIVTRIDEQRFPILCPGCTDVKDNAVASGETPSLGLSICKYSPYSDRNRRTVLGIDRNSRGKVPSIHRAPACCSFYLYYLSAVCVENFPMGVTLHLHFDSCKEGMFVDKAEYEATEVITCPLRGCNCTWCKACHREIDITGPKHSCDGTSELDHLVKQEGWKYCPGKFD